MAEGRSDFYVNLVPGFKNWDMCGSEAILSARFGIVTDAYSQPLMYEDKKGHHTLPNGILAAKNKRLLEVAHERINEKLG
jgi:3'-phosphoadenosine 5'-phosphosulfate (PAPS) 3'-phosphatase